MGEKIRSRSPRPMAHQLEKPIQKISLKTVQHPEGNQQTKLRVRL